MMDLFKELESTIQKAKHDPESTLANLYTAVDDYRIAGDTYGQARTSGLIGITKLVLGDYAAASDHFLTQRAISQKQGYKELEACALDGIGFVYALLQDKEQALTYYLKGLEISCHLDDKRQEAIHSNIELERELVEHSEIETSLQRRNHQLELLRQAGLELAAEHDLDVLLRSITWRATDFADTDQCVLFMWQPEAASLKVVATTDESIIPLGWQIKPGEGMSGQVWLTGKPIVVADYDHWQQRLNVVPSGLKAVVVVPIRWREQMLGVLNFVRHTGSPFSKEDIELAELFAAQAAVAIKNTRLLNQVQSFTYDLQLEVIERKRVEAELRQYQDNLEELVQERTVELERSNRELRRFAYVASHDLQEPLRKIQTFGNRLETLYINGLDAKGKDYLARMQRAAARMQTLIQDLLALSRVMTRQESYAEVDLSKVVQDVLRIFQEELEAANGRVYTNQLTTIEAVPVQMRQLFHNLISNALKYRQPDVPPVIKINGRVIKDNHIRITISDNGIGFDEKYLTRIFDAFQRLHTREQYEGTGIGLAICRHIVEQHHGTITARSHPNKGSAFTFTLPLQPQ